MKFTMKNSLDLADIDCLQALCKFSDICIISERNKTDIDVSELANNESLLKPTIEVIFSDTSHLPGYNGDSTMLLRVICTSFREYEKPEDE